MLSIQGLVLSLPFWLSCVVISTLGYDPTDIHDDMNWACQQMQQTAYMSAFFYAYSSLQAGILWYCCGGDELGDNYNFFKYETCYWSVIFGNDTERSQDPNKPYCLLISCLTLVSPSLCTEELSRRKQRDVFSEKAIAVTTGVSNTFNNTVLPHVFVPPHFFPDF